MGHHLLNGVKCVREARGLTNALIIWRWTGRGEECAGGAVMTRHWADAINYHWGGLRRWQGLVSPRLPRSQTSFHVSKPSLGIWTGKKKKNQRGIIPSHSHSQTRKGGKCPLPPRFPPPPQPSKDLASRWHDVTCYLSYLSNWTQARVPVSALYCQGMVGVGGGGGWQVCSRALISNHQQPSQWYDAELPFFTGPFFQFERNVQFWEWKVGLGRSDSDLGKKQHLSNTVRQWTNDGTFHRQWKRDKPMEGFSFIRPIYSSALFETEVFNALKIKAGLTTSKTHAWAWRNCGRVAAWHCSTSKACSRENLSSSRLPCFSFLISRCCSSVSISVSDSRGGLGWVRGWMLCSWHRNRADILEEESARKHVTSKKFHMRRFVSSGWCIRIF